MTKAIMILLLVIPVFYLACKKEKDPAKKLYLSKEFEDGLLTDEYFYTADKKPFRRNHYTTNTGQSVFSGFRLYEYNSSGLLETMTEFSKNNAFINKYKIQYDVSKRPTRMDDLSNDNSIQFYHVYDYDNQGNLSKFAIFNNNTNKKTVEATYTYSAAGVISKIIRKEFVFNPAGGLHDSSTYSFGGRKLPAHWTYFETFAFASLPNGDRTFSDMICDSSFFYHPDAPPQTNTYTFSNKQFNSDGYITRQNLVIKGTSGLGTTTNNYERTYEYVE